jgi:hypothetical protein
MWGLRFPRKLGLGAREIVQLDVKFSRSRNTQSLCLAFSERTISKSRVEREHLFSDCAKRFSENYRVLGKARESLLLRT